MTTPVALCSASGLPLAVSLAAPPGRDALALAVAATLDAAASAARDLPEGLLPLAAAGLEV